MVRRTNVAAKTSSSVRREELEAVPANNPKGRKPRAVGRINIAIANTVPPPTAAGQCLAGNNNSAVSNISAANGISSPILVPSLRTTGIAMSRPRLYHPERTEPLIVVLIRYIIAVLLLLSSCSPESECVSGDVGSCDCGEIGLVGERVCDETGIWGDCSCEEGDDDDATDDDIIELVDTCPYTNPPALYLYIEDRHAPHFEWKGVIEGWIWEWPNPVFHREVILCDECVLLEAHFGDCGDTCEFNEVCDANENCVEYPGRLAGGTLDVLGIEPGYTGDPVATGQYYSAFEIETSMFNVGQSVDAFFHGDELSPISMSSTGVAPVSSDEEGISLEFVSGQSHTINWDPGHSPSAIVQLAILTSTFSHGAPSAAIIWCESIDDGEIVIHEDITSRFPVGETEADCKSYDCPYSRFSRVERTAYSIGGSFSIIETRSSLYLTYSNRLQ